jgi:hypothetical protein
MRTTVALLGAVALIAPVLVLACKKDDSSQPAPGVYPTGAPGSSYGGQQGPNPSAPVYPTATAQGLQPMPGAGAAPAAGGAMAVPGPAALPCTNDAMCMTHRCNTQYGKCAFPCESDSDCIQGAFCFKSAISTCLPKAPGQQ